MSKLVKKSSKQQAESDRLIYIVKCAMVDDSMPIGCELDAVIERRKVLQDVFCEKMGECAEGEGKMLHKVTKPMPRRRGVELFARGGR